MRPALSVGNAGYDGPTRRVSGPRAARRFCRVVGRNHHDGCDVTVTLGLARSSTMQSDYGAGGGLVPALASTARVVAYGEFRTFGLGENLHERAIVGTEGWQGLAE